MKGISELVTVAFLIAIGVSVVTIYADWAPRFAENITRQTSENSDEELRCSNAAVAISEPLYDRSGDIVTFELENPGTIRFTKDIRVIALTGSIPTNNTTLDGLEVGESESGSIITQREPDTLIAGSFECPGVEDEEDKIEVRN